MTSPSPESAGGKREPWLTNPAGKMLYGLMGFFLGMAGGFLVGVTGISNTGPIHPVYYGMIFAVIGSICTGLFFFGLASLAVREIQAVSRFVEFAFISFSGVPTGKIARASGLGSANAAAGWFLLIAWTILALVVIELTAWRMTRPLLRLLRDART